MPTLVYVINLEEDVDRLRAMVEQLRTYDFLKVIRVNACRGRDLPDRACHILTGNAWSHEHKGTLGCFLSHMKTWELIANGPAPFGMVVEDDVEFRNCHILDGFMMPPECDLIFCNSRTAYPDPAPSSEPACTAVRLRSLEPVPAFIETHGAAVGGDGYLLSTGGAQKLLDFVTADRMYSHVDLRILAYCLDASTIAAEDTLKKTGRNVLRMRRAYDAQHRLNAFGMLPSITMLTRTPSARLREDQAGKRMGTQPELI